MIAGMVLSNLFYVVGAIAAASVVSAFVLLRHRRPKSLEAGIEMFNRELRALQPERRSPAAASPGSPGSPVAGSSSGRFAAEPTTQPTSVVALPAEKSGRNEARAPSPHQEDEPG